MPDIRDILKALSAEDAQMYAQSRTEMRRSYIATHAAVLGPTVWSMEDDQVVDLIDIKIAMLFMRAGRFDFENGHIDLERAQKLEAEIQERSKELQNIKSNGTPTSDVLKQYAPKPNGRVHQEQQENEQRETGWKS